MEKEISYLSEPASVEMADEWFEFADQQHFWMIWRFEVLKKHCGFLLTNGFKTLEIGCGSGVVIKQVEKWAKKPIDGCDLNQFALQKAGNTQGNLHVYDIFDFNDRLVNAYDGIMLLDVIEHIPDDTAFLEAVKKHTKAGGKIIINVPALMSLFSKYDTQAGHQRRYTKSSLKALCERCNLEIVSIQYWGILLLPVAWVRKFFLLFVKKERIIETGFSPPSRFINSFFIGLMRIENAIFKNPILGTSLFAVAKLKDD